MQADHSDRVIPALTSPKRYGTSPTKRMMDFYHFTWLGVEARDRGVSPSDPNQRASSPVQVFSTETTMLAHCTETELRAHPSVDWWNRRSSFFLACARYGTRRGGAN